MKIYIDGLFYKGAGIGRYYESLLREFAKRGIFVYTCIPEYLKDNFKDEFKDLADRIFPIYTEYQKFSIKGFLKQSKILKDLEKDVDLFFYPHINLPIYIPKKTIITIHDIIPLTKFWDRSVVKKLVFFQYLRRAIKNSIGIVTISNTTKRDLEILFKEDIGDIKVIYNFVDEKFTKANYENRNIIGDDYILFVGSRKKHKNLRNLIIAYSRIIKNINVKLVIAGPIEKKNGEINLLIKKLNLGKYVIEFISPKDEELVSLYKNAKLFVFPSFYEGFGLPPLEALSLDCPVITSNIPIFKEIYGDKIACFDPYNIENIAENILTVLKDESLRLNLLKEGKQRLKIFDKNKAVEEYIKYFTSFL